MSDREMMASIVGLCMALAVIGLGMVGCQIDANHQATEQARHTGQCVPMSSGDLRCLRARQ